jgi:hypothetical protein
VDAIAAADAAPVAVFAFLRGDGSPAAVPVTPYVDGTRVVITSSLGFIQKAELVRRDGRVALLANGVYMRGRAAVTADPSGDAFVARYLAQELRKFPPARALVQIPDHRRLLSSYFGRAIIIFEPEGVEQRPGDGGATLIARTREGFPEISPVPVEDPDAAEFDVGHAADDTRAALLIHRETEDMSWLRWVRLHGRVSGGVFHVERRVGSLTEDWTAVDHVAREARARELMKGWEQA